MKDNFSSKSNLYAKFRPTYPSHFFDYLNSLITYKNTAWDCGTGNGQVAVALAKTFTRVYASDISKAQLEQATQHPTVFYSVQQAEKTTYLASKFDLITVAQAIHWFDFKRFYSEVKRTAKPKGLLCVMGYGNIRVSKEIDVIITDFYQNILGRYWDTERRYIDEKYATIPFPFNEIKSPEFKITLHWTLEHLIGYLSTWSAVKHYIRQHKENPVISLRSKLKTYWQANELREINFPMLLRIGTIN